MKAKKLLLIFLTAILLLTCISGCKKSEEEITVDETNLVDGYYQIATIKGVKNIAEHPDGKFKVLNDIDLNGETLYPLSGNTPFTGSIDGGKYTISNFTLENNGEDNFGLFTEVKGSINNITFKDVTYKISGNEKAVGGIAGVFAGDMENTFIKKSALNYEGKVNDGASFGSMCGIAEKSTKVVDCGFGVDLILSINSGSANIGGLAGVGNGASIKQSNAAGRIVVDSNSSKVGLFLGVSNDADIRRCNFTGPMNKLNGEFFLDYCKELNGEEFIDCLYRDNTNSDDLLSEENRRIRQIPLDYMVEMASIAWTPDQNMQYFCQDGNSYCTQLRFAGVTYYGLPYGHSGGTLERFKYAFEDENCTKFKDFINPTGYDGFDLYMSNDCSAAVHAAWGRISTTQTWTNTWDMLPMWETGTIPLGEYAATAGEKGEQIYAATEGGAEQIAECFTLLHMGDAVTSWCDAKNHTHMIVENVPLRDKDGVLNIDKSYIVTHGQGEGTIENNPYNPNSTWSLNREYTYKDQLGLYYIPLTCAELLKDEITPAEVSYDGEQEGFNAIISGTVKSNYRILSINTKIEDSFGMDVFYNQFWAGVELYSEANDLVPQRIEIHDIDLSQQIVEIQKNANLVSGKAYHATITCLLSNGEELPVKEVDFVY